MTVFKPGKHGSQEYEGPLELTVDVAVIGSGAGGSAAAAALAEQGLTVAVMEEGRHWRPSDFRQDSMFALKNLYQDRGTRTARGNSMMALPGGRGVGGSTLINSAICFRCPDPVLDDWRERVGLDTITHDRFGAYFDRIWSTIGVTVQSLQVQRLNNLVFRDGAEKLGLKGEFLPRSAPGCVGCGVCQLGCPTGGKASIDRTFLAEAIGRGTVGVYADCRITGVESAGGRITAIVGEHIDPDTHAAKGPVRVHAESFILSAGPIGSPSFLQKNNLSDSSHVGQHLVVHPTASALAKMPFPIRPWHGVTQGYYVDMWDKGYLLQTYSVTPDQYWAILPLAAGEDSLSFMADLEHVASAGALVHDEDSEGSVTWTPLGYTDIRYHLGDGDRVRLIEGIRKTAEVFFAAGATQVLPLFATATAVRSPDEIVDRIPTDVSASSLRTYASHPMGTCRMSSRPGDGVVDARGLVWGWDNLRIADASIFPTSLGVNPQVTTMAMGLMVGHATAGLI